MNENMFKKSNSNSKVKVKQLEDKSLLFFGKIKINSIKYFKYACHNLDTDIIFLELCERNLNNQNTKLLDRNLRHLPVSRQGFMNQFVLLEIKKIEINRISVTDLVSVCDFIRSQKPNNSSHHILRHIADYLHSDSKLKHNDRPRNIIKIRTTFRVDPDGIILPELTFRVDPDGIILPELTKNNHNHNHNITFKIIRKNKRNSFKIDEPHVLFGEIIINKKKYYRYVCYNSTGIGSFNRVAFRELVHERNKRISRISKISKIRTNIDAQNLGVSNFFDSSNASSHHRHRPPHSSIEMQNVSKKYLYYIPIEEINSTELRRLIKNIDKYRRQKNSSFSRTIYNYVKGKLQARGENENNPFALKNNGITNNNL